MKRNCRYCAFAVAVLLALAPMSGTMSAAEITDKEIDNFIQQEIIFKFD